MSRPSPQTIERLAALVDGWRPLTEVQSIERELTVGLQRSREPFLGRPLPEALVAGLMPVGIESAWIFVLKPGIRAAPHLHPNSVQYMAIIGGEGSYFIGERRGILTPFDPASPSEAILVIPKSTPHAFEPGREPLVVLSFHTVSAVELIEVKGDRTRTYV
jgi:mannose-6-phosphate isomerase-like protein (cupin superfamily)